MTNRTRYFMLGSAVVVMAGLCTGLVAYHNGGLTLFSSARSGPADLAYVPADASVVAYANVADVMKSEIRQRLRQIIPTGSDRDKFQQETGIDIEHDVTSVVAAVIGSGAGDTNGFALVRGRFDQARIEALCREHGATTEDDNGRHFIIFAAEHGKTSTGVPGVGSINTDQETLSFLEPGLVAVGNLSALKQAIATHASATNITSNDDMAKLIGTVDGQSNAWAVGRFDALSKTANLPDVAKSELSTVQFLAVSARVDGGVTGMVHAEARDDPAAENLRDIVRGALALARLQTGHNAQLDTLINSLQMSGTGKDVALSFNLPPEVLDGINGIAALANMGRSGAPQPIKK